MTVILPNSRFLHIIKTGGMWVRVALSESKLIEKEFSARHDIPVGDPLFDSRDNGFCFVRHPVSWYRSYWAMRTMDQSWDQAIPFDNACGSDDFQEFIDNVILLCPDGYLHRVYGLYFPCVRYVGLTEMLPYSLWAILNACGETYDCNIIWNIPNQNVGNADILRRAQYASGQIDKLIVSERKIIDTFGYNGAHKAAFKRKVGI